MARSLSLSGRMDDADVWFRKAADRAAARARTGPAERESLCTAFDVQVERVQMWRASGRQDEAMATLGQLTAFLDERSADPAVTKALADEFVDLYRSIAELQE